MIIMVSRSRRLLLLLHQQNADLSFVKNSHIHQDLIMVKHNGVLKAVVPESFQEEILKECHDNHSHPSINKTDESSAGGTLTSHLIVQSAARQDSGLYTCVAENPHGRDESNIQVVVQDVPSPPTNLTVTNVTSRSVSLQWEVPSTGNSPLTSHTLVYRCLKPRGPEEAAPVRVEFPGASTHATVPGLRPVTAYSLHVLSENALGRSGPSAELNITTAEEAPEEPPQDILVQPTGAHSLKVIWKSKTQASLKTTIGRIVTEDLKLKKTPEKFNPRFLTNEQKLFRLATCEDMLEMTRTHPEWKDKIITGDETWIYDYDPETKRQSAEWRGQSEPRPKKSRILKSRNKVLLVAFLDNKGIVHHEYLPTGQTVIKEMYLGILGRLREAIRKIRPEKWTNDIAQNDFFPKLKAVLKGRNFDTRDDIIEKSLLALKSIPKEAYKNCFDNWEKRWRCPGTYGTYLVYNEVLEKCSERGLTILLVRQPPRPEAWHGQLQGYYVGYRPAQAPEDGGYQYKQVTGLETGATYLTNLRQATDYLVVVQAFNRAGPGPRSPPVQGRTLDTAPPTSPSLNIISSTTSSIYLSWDKEQNDKSVITAPRSPPVEHFITLTDPTSVTVNLSAWNGGGCPIREFSVAWRSRHSRRWTPSSPGRLPGGLHVVRGLVAGREYDMLVTAHSAAGDTQAEYEVRTPVTAIVTPRPGSPGESPLMFPYWFF
ncbi:hypothetical protein LAZ67_1006387 [Cordylochernes scorpioides]|uniref:Fibronectin type-III domain-containing protein n=1 Tax=Cordylochernes scorpioides TaxID=51811 RepID=A0ABY6K040_9ARAC|nr:hypothetical protein LAZ67_1006387 [Cordylochernes scorpioides]